MITSDSEYRHHRLVGDIHMTKLIEMTVVRAICRRQVGGEACALVAGGVRKAG